MFAIIHLVQVILAPIADSARSAEMIPKTGLQLKKEEYELWKWTF